MGFDLKKMMPQQNQMRTDLSKIDDIECVKCKNKRFALHGSIKMISPIQSTSGKWDQAINAQWVCIACHHPFNPSEWLNKQADELRNSQLKKADD